MSDKALAARGVRVALRSYLESLIAGKDDIDLGTLNEVHRFSRAALDLVRMMSIPGNVSTTAPVSGSMGNIGSGGGDYVVGPLLGEALASDGDGDSGEMNPGLGMGGGNAETMGAALVREGQAIVERGVRQIAMNPKNLTDALATAIDLGDRDLEAALRKELAALLKVPALASVRAPVAAPADDSDSKCSGTGFVPVRVATDTIGAGALVYCAGCAQMQPCDCGATP